MDKPQDMPEREAFEAWIRKDGGDLSTFGSGKHVHYHNTAVESAWEAWQARASLAEQRTRAMREAPCPHCLGSGEKQYMTNHLGPDDYEVTGICRPCSGTGDAPLTAILDEVARATSKFPTWPTDPLHAVAVLGEEFGELTKAVLQRTYEPHKSTDADVRMEAIQTAAMALRFAMSLGAYEHAQCEQHKQEAL